MEELKMAGTEYRQQYGITLLEMLVAITIAGIVTSLCFITYGNVTRAFSRQSRMVADLGMTVIHQKRIDRACKRLSILHRCTEREVSGVNGDNDGSRTLRYFGGVLFDGGDTIAVDLETLSFTLVENEENRKDRNAVLLWEGIIAKSGHWIGGAAAVKR